MSDNKHRGSDFADYVEEQLERLAKLEKVLEAARSVNENWNEFGPEHGQDELQHLLYGKLKALDSEQGRDGEGL